MRAAAVLFFAFAAVAQDETTIATLPERFDAESIVVNRDNSGAAFKFKEHGNWFVNVNGSRSEAFERIDRVVFNGAIAFRCMRAGKWTVVYWKPPFAPEDAVSFELYPRVEEPVLSPNGSRVAFRAARGGDAFIVTNDGIGEDFDDVTSDPIFSPDSTTMIYRAIRNDRTFVVINGTKSEDYDAAEGFTFSRDGKSYAYAARKGGKWFLVTNAQAGKPARFDRLRDPVFSPDGARVAFTAQAGGKWAVHNSGKKGEDFDEVSAPVFSPDCKTLAYLGMREGKRFAVVGGESTECGGAGGFTFNEDGRKCAYRIHIGEKWKICGDEEEFDEIDSISATGEVVAFRGRIGTKWYAVVDGKKGAEFELVDRLTLSPDKKKCAYIAFQNKKWFLMLNEKKSEPYDGVWNPIFDGSRFSYVVRKEKKILGMSQ